MDQNKIQNNKVFADTSYWISIIRNDEWTPLAKALAEEIKNNRIIIYTSQLIFSELLTYIVRKNVMKKSIAKDLILDIARNKNVIVVEFKDIDFKKILDHFSSYNDKGWSFVDHSSIMLSDTLEISEILSSDEHFNQAGKIALLKT